MARAKRHTLPGYAWLIFNRSHGILLQSQNDRCTDIILGTPFLLFIAWRSQVAVVGTTGNDTIPFLSAGGRNVRVRLNGANLGVFQSTTRVLAFGQEGNRLIDMIGGRIELAPGVPNACVQALDSAV
jgi:hypothetical protein